jgi:hypothetical protein
MGIPALALVHPAIGALALGTGVLTLRQGLALRDVRRLKGSPPVAGFSRHLGLARACTLIIACSAATGVASVALLRDWSVGATWHGRVGAAAVGLFFCQWLLGRTLVKGRKQVRSKHALLGLAAIFSCGIAALLGIELLP